MLGYGLCQWENALLCNAFSHWQSPYPEWCLWLNTSCTLKKVPLFSRLIILVLESVFYTDANAILQLSWRQTTAKTQNWLVLLSHGPREENSWFYKSLSGSTEDGDQSEMTATAFPNTFSSMKIILFLFEKSLKFVPSDPNDNEFTCGAQPLLELMLTMFYDAMWRH